MKIKVLFIIWSLERGGAERFLAGLLQNINLDQFEPVLCCLNKKGEWASIAEERGIKVIELNKKKGFDLKAFLKLKHIIKLGQFDIVNTHLWGADVQGRIAAILSKTPVIISTAQNVDEWKKFHHHLVDRILGKKTNCIIAVSQAVKDFYHQIVGIPYNKIDVIPNAIDVSKYENIGDTSDLYSEFKISKDDYVFACIGRLDYQKGHSYLMQSLAQLKDTTPFVKVLIIGDGTLREDLERMAKELKIEDMVRFTGRRSDIPQLLKFSNALILSSIFEGLPLCVLEAMASARPVIATDVGGTAELAVNDETAFIIPSKNVPALTEAIKKLTDLPDHGKEMGQKGKNIVQEKFSIQKITKQTEDLFTSYF